MLNINGEITKRVSDPVAGTDGPIAPSICTSLREFKITISSDQVLAGSHPLSQSNSSVLFPLDVQTFISSSDNENALIGAPICTVYDFRDKTFKPALLGILTQESYLRFIGTHADPQAVALNIDNKPLNEWLEFYSPFCDRSFKNIQGRPLQITYKTYVNF